MRKRRITIGQGLHGDLLAVVAVAGSGHCYHPNAVLPVAGQVRDSVEIDGRRGLELAHHLGRHTRDVGLTNEDVKKTHR